MAAMKIYVIGGLLLLLASPFWVLGVPLPLEQNESVWVYMYRMGANEWARWLGVLALALGLLQGYVVLSKGLKAAVGLLFLMGSVLMPYSRMRGEFGHPSMIYLLGVGLVGAALVANLVGVVRFPPKAKT